MTGRPNIPAAVKREVRRRCAFGCVFCGRPIYDYEHIEGFGATGHDPEQLTLLCPEHHREKTAGRLPVRQVRARTRHPYNAGATVTRGRSLFYDTTVPLQLVLGNTAFTPGAASDMVGISVDGDLAFGVGLTEIGTPVIEMDIRDMDDRLHVRVANSQVRPAVSNWDVTFEGRRLTVRDRARHKVLDVVFDATGGAVLVERAEFALHHVRVRVGHAKSEGGLEVLDEGNSWTSCVFVQSSLTLGAGAPGIFHSPTPSRAYGAPPAPFASSWRR